MKELHERGVQVYLVSGGFRSLIEPVAELLGIPLTNIFANRLKFYFNGEYLQNNTRVVIIIDLISDHWLTYTLLLDFVKTLHEDVSKF